MYQLIGQFMSGKAKIGVDDKCFFKLSSASCVSSVQVKKLLVSLALCNGRAIIAMFLMYRLYYEQSPKYDLTYN